MKDLGELKFILGMEIKRDRANRKIEISQERARPTLPKCSRDLVCPSVRPVATPADGILCRISAENGGRADKLYMSVVGSLLYAAMITRPDITYAVQALGRHMPVFWT